jgi:predicted N-acyltransferase
MQDKADKTAAMNELHISVIGGIGEVSAAEWDACANPRADLVNEIGGLGSTPPPTCEPNGGSRITADKSDQIIDYNPFLSHDFLAALEDSHSVGPRTGWQPQHVLARIPDGTLVAVALAYLKSHSRG